MTIEAPDSRIKGAITALLDQLDITRIVVVDDDLDESGDQSSLLQVKSHFAAMRPQLSRLAETYGVDDLVEDLRNASEFGEEIRDDIDLLWGRLSDEEKLILAALIPDSGHESDNLAALDAIRPFLPARISYEPMSVSRWKATCEDLFQEGHPHTLVFFDRQLSEALGGRRGGDLLVQQLHSKDRVGVYCGLLTQDASDLAEETRISEELRSLVDAAVPAIGKYRIRTPEAFVQGLQFFLHITELARVKKHTEKALVAAFESTKSFLDGIGYYVILASAASAHDEGVFEGDGLLRLARSHFRRGTERLLAADPPARELQLLRKATGAAISEVLPSSPDARLLEWGDRFDSGEDLRNSKSPTEVGDIYELTGRDGTKTHVILLAQACDLVVRKAGERANAPAVFTLAQLEEIDSPAETESGRLLPVGRLVHDSDASVAANLAKRVYLPPQVLDACVISDDGLSRFPLSMSHPGALTAGWVKRPAKLQNWAKGRVAEARKLIDLLPSAKEFPERDQVAQRLYEAAFGPSFVEGSISLTVDRAGAVVVGVRRVSRLVESHAKALLVQFSQYQSRPDVPARIMRHGKRGLLHE
ncbi:hypothetical protein [Cellulomonas sp. C5510]|uniref:hypothetical protein n=1 Tax=Cellulomonas sp. C5510 TaxID=2871170 RepID=UPI001C941D36|nr:hypothetical protein [Cellulomonas sp. C5510]QZN85421.1 hypothetical protein K5O09_16920 [Cellulomonas sp. C5510]